MKIRGVKRIRRDPTKIIRKTKKIRDSHSAVSLLRSIYAKCQRGYINLRFLPSGKNLFISLKDIFCIPRILKKFAGRNGYFGVATRMEGNGTKEGILQIPALWVDLDFNGQPPERVYGRLAKFRRKPSAIVETGGGYHAYWFLKTPAAKKDITMIESLLKRIADSLQADKSATDASRILRIPGGKNWKHNGFQVRVKIFNPQRRYRISDFDFLSEIREEREIVTTSKGWADRIFMNGVAEGARNDTLTRLAGRYVRRGFSKIETRAILAKANEGFRPPVDEREIIKIVQSVSRLHLRKNLGKRGDEFSIDYPITDMAAIYQAPAPEYLIEPLILQGTVTILGGYTGEGKSIIALSMANAVITGEPLWGQYPVKRRGPVLYADEENPLELLRERCQKMGIKEDSSLVFLHRAGVRVDKRNYFNGILDKIDEIRPALIVFDTLVRVHRQKENDASLMSRVMERFRQIADKGVPVLIIHHFKKGESSPAQRLRGSTDIPGGVDVAYAITRKGKYCIFESVKSRIQAFKAIKLEMVFGADSTGIFFRGAVKGEREYVLSRVQEILENTRAADFEKIRRELKKAKVTIGSKKLREILNERIGRELSVEKRERGKKIYRVNPAWQNGSSLDDRQSADQSESNQKKENAGDQYRE